jgi:polyprenyl-phospho-N-acetylgalactosaminyl synthase
MPELERSIWVIIAAFNEGSIIARVVAELRKPNYHVVLVDDGSIDDTGRAGAMAGAVVVTHPVNLG